VEHVKAYQSIYKGTHAGILNIARLLKSLDPHKKFGKNDNEEESVGWDSKVIGLMKNGNWKHKIH
jgi:hypothetical protein